MQYERVTQKLIQGCSANGTYFSRLAHGDEALAVIAVRSRASENADLGRAALRLRAPFE